MAEKVGAGFLFCCDGQALLLKRNSKHNDKTWGLPGGNCDPGEDALSCAVREASEELGHLPSQYQVIGQMTTRRGKRSQKVYSVFLSTIPLETKDSYVPQLNKEHTEWSWFPINSIKSMAEASVAREEEQLHPVVTALFLGESQHMLKEVCA
ncbi:hypothetical protein CEUSTIGMA_g6120.t1 [Chlamydomonas eustigma]|uniref:Nudix hydrolase domain-containing protein n=1 Tax=Chlamydomonas eustigma TaxID=1157962 RepID=A0A250X715_9CHLO|nr:hypothetical protein CEUSTIGMA_g6120.t1 [Chlamydomonas eustigma]|eukprot:GAX78682.1 hypothetical protein CEUSTIGMA_g6120.t1 [Chlamydomonas eustigma]